jgi:excisionase family DNA binding protein
MPDDTLRFNPATEVSPKDFAFSTEPRSAKARGKTASTAQETPVALCAVSPIAVTIKQAAKLMGTNDKQIRRAIYAREIPVARLGKSYSIAVADLIQWFDRRKAFL